MAPFDPAHFHGTAERLMAAATNESDYRTVAGRSYYAVYGTLCEGLRSAKGLPSEHRFRHGPLANQVSYAAKPFKKMASDYNSLLVHRVLSDYRYGDTMTHQKARSVVDAARRVLRELGKASRKDFRQFQLPPTP